MMTGPFFSLYKYDKIVYFELFDPNKMVENDSIHIKPFTSVVTVQVYIRTLTKYFN